MGGLIAVGLIANGELKTVVGHTNTLPQTIKNRRFAEGDIEQFEGWFDRYGVRNLPENMDDEAFGFSAHVPSEYGYVLVDLNERVVLSAQDYTSFTTISGPRVETDDEAAIVAGRIVYDDHGETTVVAAGPYATAQQFADDPDNDPRGGVPTLGEFFNELRALVPDWKPETGMGFVDLFEAAHGTLTRKAGQALLDRYKSIAEFPENAPTFHMFELDLKDWSVFDGSRQPGDLATIRDYLSERGLLSADELAEWESYLQSMFPDEEADRSPAPTL